MSPRYQVFVSSTFLDLQAERAEVAKALLSTGCFPAGMELFPAADEEQWRFIQKVIDDCDYYVVIVGGRYGSLTQSGVSYTEREYEYAKERGLPVLAFLHDAPHEIPVGKSELEAGARARLDAFRKTLSTGRLVKGWKNASELPALVTVSLMQTMMTSPGTGWIRGSLAATPEILGELNDQRKRNEALQSENDALRAQVARDLDVSDLAPMDAVFPVGGRYSSRDGGYTLAGNWKAEPTWSTIFALLAPFLLDHPLDTRVHVHLGEVLGRLSREKGTRLSEHDFETIKVQFMAYGLVQVRYVRSTSGAMGLSWSLTEAGHAHMMRLRTVKRT